MFSYSKITLCRLDSKPDPYIVKKTANVSAWSSGMILALGASGRGFDSLSGPKHQKIEANNLV